MGKYFKKKVKKKSSHTLLQILYVIGGFIIIALIIYLVILIAKRNNNAQYVVKNEYTIQINSEKPNKRDLFEVYQNIEDGKVTVDYTNLDITSVGDYDIKVTVNNEKNNVTIHVIDTQKPSLRLKSLTIKEGETYTINDFVQSCVDNSNKDCLLSFNDETDSYYNQVGTYEITIIAADESGNSNKLKTSLVITKKDVKPEPVCEFGSLEPNDQAKDLPIAYYIKEINNNCPIDIKMYKSGDNSELKEKIDSQYIVPIYDKDTDKLFEQTKNYRQNNPSLHRSYTVFIYPIANKEGRGVIGYVLEVFLYIAPQEFTTDELNMAIDKDPNNNEYTKYLKERYYIKEDGSRQYSVNDYNLP